MGAVVGLFAYVVAVLIIISAGIVGLMALQSPLERMPSKPMVSSASGDAITRALVHRTMVSPKKEMHRSGTRKRVSRAHKQETPPDSGRTAYGYVQEPRRIYPYSLSISGQ